MRRAGGRKRKADDPKDNCQTASCAVVVSVGPNSNGTRYSTPLQKSRRSDERSRRCRLSRHRRRWVQRRDGYVPIADADRLMASRCLHASTVHGPSFNFLHSLATFPSFPFFSSSSSSSTTPHENISGIFLTARCLPGRLGRSSRK